MGLLDFVQQDHGVGTAPDGLRQLPPLVVADVARRGADQAGHRVPLHVFGHVEADHGLFTPEHERRERARQQGLADARGAEEDERADGPPRVLEAGARPTHGAGNGLDGLILAHDRLVQCILHVEQTLGLLFLDAGHGDTGPHTDDLRDHLVVNFGALFLALVLTTLLQPLNLLAQGGLFIAQGTRPLVVLFLD